MAEPRRPVTAIPDQGMGILQLLSKEMCAHMLKGLALQQAQSAGDAGDIAGVTRALLRQPSECMLLSKQKSVE